MIPPPGGTLASPADLVLHFGSRTGSTFALALFAVAFGALGVGAARECRRRRFGLGPSNLVGLPLFPVPLLLLCGSSLNGSYEVHVSGPHPEHGYLSPLSAQRLAWPELSRIEARPAFRGRWRLHLILASGGERESATGHRHAVGTAAPYLRGRLGAASHGEPR